MDRSEVKRIVEEALEPMATALWVRDWLILPEYGAIEDGKCGFCKADPAYMKATIRLDPAQLDDEDDVLRTLRHEILHIVHGEFAVYMNMMLCAVKEKDWRMKDVEDRAYTLACERTVARLERLLDGLGQTPRVLAGLDVARAADCEACGREWKAIHPRETEALECPDCHILTPVRRFHGNGTRAEAS
jgi:hypothetical protein